MSFSSAVLLIALVTALLAIAGTRARRPRDARTWCVLGAGTFGVAVLGAIVSLPRNEPAVFGFAHVAYVIATVGFPAVAATWFIAAKRSGESDRTSKALVGLGLLAVVGGIYGTHIEPNWLRVDRQTFGSPLAVEPLRVGVLADLQTPNIGDHEWNAVDLLIAESPDLVLVPGDLYQGPPESISANRSDFVALVERLVEETDTVVIVTGNSDRRPVLETIAAEAGATFLHNEVVETSVNGIDVRLAGVSVASKAKFQPNRARTLSSLETADETLTILVSHRPDVAYELPPQTRVDLVVSGHTHGGQIALPWFGPILTQTEVPRTLAAGGLDWIGDVPVYVSTGVGLERRSAPQVRFGVRPSVGIIDVVPMAG